MKKFGFAVIILVCGVFMSMAYQERINEMWCRNAMKSRSIVMEKGDVFELVEYDRDLISRISDAEFVFEEKGERRLIDLLHQIVIDNNRPNEKNTVAVIDLLNNKFDDKSYVVNMVLELISVNKVPNYRILVKIMDVFTASLSNDTASKIFMGLGMLYGKLDQYFFDPNGQGASTVLKSFLNFIYKYCDMVTNKKTLKDDYRRKICEYADKLELGKKPKGNVESQYAVVSNWEKVGRAFYFYKIGEEYDFGMFEDAGESNGR